MPPRTATADVVEQILAAATELFAARDYATVKVPEIAAKARVGLNTLYQHFPSKEALGNAVFRKCRRTWAAFTLDRWPDNAPPAEEFATYWRHLCEYAEADINIARYNERERGHIFDAESTALQREIDRRSEQALRSWVASHQVRDLQFEVMKALIHGTFDRIIHLPVSKRRRREMLGAAGASIWRALAADPASRH